MGEDGADVRPFQYIALDANHGEVAAGFIRPRRRATRRGLKLKTARLHIDKANGEAFDLSGYFGAGNYWDWFAFRRETDAATEEQLQIARIAIAAAHVGAKLKQAQVFAEKFALLGKEKWKPGNVHDLLINVRLREIRMDRKVSSQTRSDAILHIHAGIESAA